MNQTALIVCLCVFIPLLILVLFCLKKSKNNKHRNLQGQVIIITGSNQGIGFEVAKDCSRSGARVILACRNREKSQSAIDEINQINPGSVDFIKLDLSDLSSVRQFVKEFQSKYNKLDILINNAGIIMQQRVMTKDGLETQIATNHFGPFLLTNLLLDSLKASNQFRVITVTSWAFQFTNIDFDDINFEKRKYKNMDVYGQSKVANTLFTIGLQQKIDQLNLNGISVCLHPGSVRTNMFQNFSPIFKCIYFCLYPIIFLTTKSTSQGAQTAFYCIHEDYDKLNKAAYYEDCKQKLYKAKSITEENVQKLWAMSTKIVNL
ncbi:oxidoreductase, short chain dehydrogenase/reductase family protein (macronuclear) [Tetrahymena thermophila SB210]|uniref:Oxidoreductase, short chain dehydrogenase/reductase family protein n=1 Tax=Tetrahymena thermophila (strain SB210) TaxID=312017 RepID=I7MCN5_TETTS|nr:oxidoreductase, short chain dehydrogenase/reductase family protein [Tetrahymena thermophila SB210]EAR84432.1 oxidoreductase, short chain dehydrogenase/reductase family protein [Tetrahymena thermophila SB210]|eukprot:XP_001032095.1 oxidoreductase, short chain dehydrogenase/reductase family protein [Tetrahymena thermophila SB210]